MPSESGGCPGSRHRPWSGTRPRRRTSTRRRCPRRCRRTRRPDRTDGPQGFRSRAPPDRRTTRRSNHCMARGTGIDAMTEVVRRSIMPLTKSASTYAAMPDRTTPGSASVDLRVPGVSVSHRVTLELRENLAGNMKVAPYPHGIRYSGRPPRASGKGNSAQGHSHPGGVRRIAGGHEDESRESGNDNRRGVRDDRAGDRGRPDGGAGDHHPAPSHGRTGGAVVGRRSNRGVRFRRRGGRVSRGGVYRDRRWNRLGDRERVGGLPGRR